jgi:uncharacterized protein YdaU (DUF1376 family)
MHYFKFNIGDYHKKAGRLSMLEHGAYTLLIHSCYDRERFPNLEEAISWCWARSEEEILAVKFVLKQFFALKDGVFVQPRIEDEIAKYQEKSAKNRAIAEEREARKRTKRAQVVQECEPLDQDREPNQEPINQEPINQIKRRSAASAAISKPDEVSQQVWDDFHVVRKKKGAPLTSTAFALFCVEAEKANLPLEEALKICCQYNWQTFKADWYAERKPKASEGISWEAAGWK